MAADEMRITRERESQQTYTPKVFIIAMRLTRSIDTGCERTRIRGWRSRAAMSVRVGDICAACPSVRPLMRERCIRYYCDAGCISLRIVGRHIIQRLIAPYRGLPDCRQSRFAAIGVDAGHEAICESTLPQCMCIKKRRAHAATQSRLLISWLRRACGHLLARSNCSGVRLPRNTRLS